MKFFILSDIHGDALCCKKALEIFKQSDYAALLLLGDILYHGPRNSLPDYYDPKKVIELLNPLSEQIIAVKGNCDGEVDQMVLNFPILSPYNQFYLNKRKVFMTHGHTITKEHPCLLPSASLFLYGHTHIPEATKEKDLIFLNPGSVSLPKNGFPPSYAILEENSFSVFSLHTQQLMMKIEF